MKPRSALIALCLVTSAVGCSSSSPEPPDLTGLTFDERQGEEGRPEAALDGRLSEANGCVYLTDREGVSWVLSFPPGAVERAPTGIAVHGRTYAFGSEYSAPGQDFPAGKGFTAPPSCDTSKMWMTFPD